MATATTGADRPSPANRGGRPSRAAAAQLRDRILDVATGLFLGQGFAATSIAAVARGAGISKRTFYHRFADKAALFRAVVGRLIERWLEPFEASVAAPAPIEETLRRAARRILAVALSAEALALHRVLMAESRRFPELAQAINQSAARQGVLRIAALLDHEARAGRLAVADTGFAAEQFITMVLSGPRARALGFGQALDAEGLEAWAHATVALFLEGCRGHRPA